MTQRLDWNQQRRLARRFIPAQRRLSDQGLNGQFLDGFLLQKSRLYQKSRQEFLRLGGSFRPALLSSPRTLSSGGLVDPQITYTPSGDELAWSMLDPIQSRNAAHFTDVRRFSTSIFHEQNHRILWSRLLPPPPPARHPSLMLYLNLAESLTVMLDQALGDELGPEVSGFFYQAGVVYDPGTPLRSEIRSRRKYRNALHAGMYSTWLALGGMPPRETKKIVGHLYPEAAPWTERAVARSLKLDPRFVQNTNPIWQGRHARAARLAIERLRAGRTAGPEELVPRDPLDHRLVWLTAERALEAFTI